MCGVGGIIRTDGQPIPGAWLDALEAGFADRGPDGRGRMIERVEYGDGFGLRPPLTIEIALVHRRLAVIDPAGGEQPMVSAAGRDESEGFIAVIFNGCIYNHRELRRELCAAGHRFTTDHSDTEALIHGWREWGEGLVDRLEGMYAFALWDARRATLVLARDRFGKKPLYVAEAPGPGGIGETGVRGGGSSGAGVSGPTSGCPALIAFSSDPAGLALLPLFRDAVDRGAMERWVRMYLQLGYEPQGPGVGLETEIDEAAHRASLHAGAGAHDADHRATLLPRLQALPGAPLPAGHVRCIRFREGEDRTIDHRAFDGIGSACVTDGRGGQFHDGHAAAHSGDEGHLDRFERFIDQAVSRRLEADVPLGCFLSGGVDSSLVASFARRHRPELRTFCVKMPVRRFDESEHAARAARHIGTSHTTLSAAVKPAEDLTALVRQLGRPFADSSILPTFWVSRAAREHVTVALSGDGGDELFLGYQRYMAARLLARRHALIARLPRGLFTSAPAGGGGLRSRLHRLITMARDYPATGLLATESIFSQEQIDRLLGSRGHAGRAAVFPEPMPDGRGGDAMAALRQADLEWYLPGDLMRKVDIASMAVALEVRCPFLDRDLVNAARATPVDLLLYDARRKGLLRALARRHLPREIIDRPKMGFTVPIGEWFRINFGGLRSMLLDHLTSAEPFGPIHLDRAAVRGLLDAHLVRGIDHSHRLFALLTLSIWARGS